MLLRIVQANLVPRAGGKEGRPRCSHPNLVMLILQEMATLRLVKEHGNSIGIHSPVRAREVSLEDAIEDIEKVDIRNYKEISRIHILKAVLPRFQALMKRARARGDERGSLRTPGYKPSKRETEVDGVETQTQEAGLQFMK